MFSGVASQGELLNLRGCYAEIERGRERHELTDSLFGAQGCITVFLTTDMSLIDDGRPPRIFDPKTWEMTD